MKEYYQSEVLMQLFLDGPTWDGNLICKAERNELVEMGLVERSNGWNYLNASGLYAALVGGMSASDLEDNRWYKKASLQ